jgi:hypothetical protein
VPHSSAAGAWPAPGGAVSVGDDGATIHIDEKEASSTVVHAGAHVWRRLLDPEMQRALGA